MQAITQTMALPTVCAEDLTDDELAAIIAGDVGLRTGKDQAMRDGGYGDPQYPT
jgi:hypothetical protein